MFIVKVFVQEKKKEKRKKKIVILCVLKAPVQKSSEWVNEN